MADTFADFQQILLTHNDVASLMPDWPERMVEDYLLFKRDLGTSTGAGDETTQDVLWLEHRVLGEARPAPYNEAAGYLTGDLVVYPTADPQTYYFANEDIPVAAGVFDPDKWRPLNLIGVLIEIIRVAVAARDNFVLAGYGSISASTPGAVGDINQIFQVITGFDTSNIAPNRVTYDLPNDGLQFDVEGTWQFTINVTATFDELNSGREIQLIIANATAVTFSQPLTFFVARNVGGVNMSVTIMVTIGATDIGDLYQVQIGSAADLFTTSVITIANYAVTHVSEKVGDL